MTRPSASPPKVATAEVSPDAAALANVQAVIDGGGQIMVGTVAPIRDAAVAHDGRKTLAMLRRRPREAISDLLARLDAAIATARATGSRGDEINTTGSDRSYSCDLTTAERWRPNTVASTATWTCQTSSRRCSNARRSKLALRHVFEKPVHDLQAGDKVHCEDGTRLIRPAEQRG